MSKSLIEYSKFIKISKCDLVIILGDRYEAFVFAIASFFLKKNSPYSWWRGYFWCI